MNRQVFGPQTEDVAAVSQYTDWGAFAKVRPDSEFAQFLDDAPCSPRRVAEQRKPAVSFFCLREYGVRAGRQQQGSNRGGQSEAARGSKSPLTVLSTNRRFLLVVVR